MSQQTQHVVVTSTKSMGISILLTVLFGPLGMLYSTVIGALVMIVASLIIGVVTFGLGLLLTWPICVIWGAMAVGSYNSGILRGAKRY